MERWSRSCCIYKLKLKHFPFLLFSYTCIFYNGIIPLSISLWHSANNDHLPHIFVDTHARTHMYIYHLISYSPACLAKFSFIFATHCVKYSLKEFSAYFHLCMNWIETLWKYIKNIGLDEFNISDNSRSLGIVLLDSGENIYGYLFKVGPLATFWIFIVVDIVLITLIVVHLCLRSSMYIAS